MEKVLVVIDDGVVQTACADGAGVEVVNLDELGCVARYRPEDYDRVLESLGGLAPEIRAQMPNLSGRLSALRALCVRHRERHLPGADWI